jgi:hypothetical protein
MIARLVPYGVRPDAVAPLIEEIVAVARARSRWPAQWTNRRAEFFVINTSSGDGLSLVVGDDRTVTPAIELERLPSEDPEELDVHLLQLGGRHESGVAGVLFGRVVRCDSGSVEDLSFNRDAVPSSPDVRARALVVAPNARVVAFAVATDRASLEHSLLKFSARCTEVDDYRGCLPLLARSRLSPGKTRERLAVAARGARRSISPG